ncbi:MAG: hypothetical protein NZ534_09945, partial [Bacteroidia bacterium]|nr:hypothetical protein [Bacteroidia bacterium]
CPGEATYISGLGAITYRWIFNGQVFNGPGLFVNITEPDTLYAIPIVNNCAGDTVAIPLTTGPQVDIQPNGPHPLCQGEAVELFAVSQDEISEYQWFLNGTPLAGQTGASIAAGEFGFYSVRVYSLATGCYALSDSVQVIPGGQVNASIQLESTALCFDASPMEMFGSPSGGTFSGPGVNGNLFFPALAGTGTHVVVYSGIIGGCEYSTSVALTVHPPAVAFFQDLSPQYCSNSSLCYQLFASIDGGTFAGPGVSAGVFCPSVAGAGQHVLTYSGINNNGCAYSTSAVVTVATPAAAQIVGFEPYYCYGDPNCYVATASPPGGQFSGPVVADENNPSVCRLCVQGLSQGIHVITYSGFDENGCEYSTSVEVVILEPTITRIFAPDSICENAPAVLLSGIPFGGVLSGPGINGSFFVPSQAGIGTHTLTYSGVNEFGCGYSTTRDIVVFSAPSARILGLASTHCTGNACVTLSGEPSGGSFSGPGISGNVFCPAAAGPGTHAITYSGVTPEGCAYSTTHAVVVNPTPAVDVGGLQPFYCFSHPCVPVSVSPPGGQLLGPGVTGYEFCPALAGPGNHTLVYRFVQNGCAVERALSVRVGAPLNP